MAKLLTISSQVMRGRVGGSLTSSALELLGHEVWVLPTILLSTRPGYGAVKTHAFPPHDIGQFFTALENDGALSHLGGVMTGYFPSAEHVAETARIIAQIKVLKPECVFVCDPVLGDIGKGLYIDEKAARAVRDELVPLADVITPNRFELEWLAATPEIADAAQTLNVDVTMVTSAHISQGSVTNKLFLKDRSHEYTAPHLANIPNGTGDLFAAMVLHALVAKAGPEGAFTTACEILERVTRNSQGHNILQFSEALKKMP